MPKSVAMSTDSWLTSSATVRHLMRSTIDQAVADKIHAPHLVDSLAICSGTRSLAAARLLALAPRQVGGAVERYTRLWFTSGNRGAACRGCAIAKRRLACAMSTIARQ